MDEFDNSRQADVHRRHFPKHLRREQKKSRTNPFPSSAQQVFTNLADGSYFRTRVSLQLFLDKA
jgi:hypothetical protein